MSNQIQVKSEFSKNLDVTVNVCEAEAINSFQEITRAVNQQSVDPENLEKTENTENPGNIEQTTVPGSEGFKGKVGVLMAIVTLLSTSPIFIKLLEGGELREIAVFAADLIKQNVVIISIFGAIYLMRAVILTIFKQIGFLNRQEYAADKSKNNVEIVTEVKQ